MNTAIDVKQLSVTLGNRHILHDINVSVPIGKITTLIGPNGCGKSTLLKSIANIIEYRGNVKIDDKEVNNFSRVDLAKKVALMSQMSQVYFPYTVYDTVSLGRYAYSKGAFSKLSKQDREIVEDSMKKVGVYELKDKLITELSGGQLQRVFLAKIFAQDPDIILLDEPTNHLDFKHQIELLENLSEWVKKNNKIVIGVLHDLNLVQYFADNVLMIKSGKGVSYGKPEDVFKRDVLNDIYGIDIKEFMLNILEKWA